MKLGNMRCDGPAVHNALRKKISLLTMRERVLNSPFQAMTHTQVFEAFDSKSEGMLSKSRSSCSLAMLFKGSSICEEGLVSLVAAAVGATGKRKESTEKESMTQ